MNIGLLNLSIFFRCRLALIILYLFKWIDHVLRSIRFETGGTKLQEKNSTSPEQQGQLINITQ